MNYNDAQEAELKTIPEFSNRVFPLVAQQKTEAPFCVYKKISRQRQKFLSGTSQKCTTVYDIFVLSKSYSQLQDLTDSTVDKVISFIGRQIGTGGPIIENVSIEEMEDEYEMEPELYKSHLRITAKY